MNEKRWRDSGPTNLRHIRRRDCPHKRRASPGVANVFFLRRSWLDQLSSAGLPIAQRSHARSSRVPLQGVCESCWFSLTHISGNCVRGQRLASTASTSNKKSALRLGCKLARIRKPKPNKVDLRKLVGG